MRHQLRAVADEATTESGYLFERYSERVFAFCLHMLRDRGEAEDAVQTTFLHAHRALQRGVTPEFEYAWLHSIAKNVCRMQQRTAARRTVVTNVDLDAMPGRHGEDEAEQELLRGMREALASLPDRQRRALVMREFQGLSSEEVASQLGMSAPATYALLTRARRSLARALTVAGRTALGLDFGSIVLRLRGLVGGGAAKVATTTAIAAVVTVGAVAVEQGLGKRGSAGGPAVSAPVARQGSPRAVVTADPRGERWTGGGRVAGTSSSAVSIEASDHVPAPTGAPRSDPQAAIGAADAPSAPHLASDPPEPELAPTVVELLQLEVDTGGLLEILPADLPETGDLPLPLPEEGDLPLPGTGDLPPPDTGDVIGTTTELPGVPTVELPPLP